MRRPVRKLPRPFVVFGLIALILAIDHVLLVIVLEKILRRRK